MAIREASEGDLAALLPLLRGYCVFYESDPTDEGLEAMLRAIIASPEDEAFLLLATDQGSEEIVGFAACQWKWSALRGARVVLLDDLFVAEVARGAGHADALIGATAEIARRHGAPLVVWYTQASNLRAQGVYDRVGGSSEQMLEYQLAL
jgi:GNAT superfamily N-acetyltransferase